MYREAPTPECPACHVPMVEVTADGAEGWQCEQCEGIWMAEAAFWSLYRHHQPDLVATDLLVHNDGTPRRECPACHELMDIAWIDFLQLDQCSRGHGVWFDAGELQRALRNEVGQEAIAAAQRIAAMRRKQQKKR